MARITSRTRIKRNTSITAAGRLSLRAVALVLSLGCLESGMSIARGSGSWVVKPPPGTPIDSTAPLANGLVGVWHFDQSGPPLNLVNAALSGAYQGSPTLLPTQDGFGVSALTDADYLRVDDASQVLNFTTGPFSVEADFYYGAAAPGAVIVGRDYATLHGYSIQIANDGVGRRVVAQLHHGGTSDVVQTGTVLQIGAINRVLVTYSGSTATIYVNGVNQASGPYTPPTLGPEPLAVGRDAVTGGMNFNNPTTRLVMWSRVLTPGEALQVTSSDPYVYMVAPAGTQPAASTVSVGPITQSSAVVSWTTNVPSDSLVRYGPTVAYGFSSALDPALVTAHSQTLSGLSTGTLYHYQVVSRDSAGAIVATPDSTFTPLAGMDFADDFNGSSLDGASWTALNRPGNSGNGEAQYYLPSNATVSSGSMRLTSRLDGSIPGFSYTSSMVQWPTFNFQYGTLEIRAKLTGGTGPWPSFRLVGTNCQQTNMSQAGASGPCNPTQPGSDEIDVASILNSNVFAVNQQIHSGVNNAGCLPSATDVSANWHTYGLVWSPGSLEWKIDGATTCTVTTGVPSTPMFLLMNVAMGGSGGGAINGATLPQPMDVDYVRLYQQTDTQPPTVIGVFPGGGATAVATSTPITATFSEAMAPATINTGTVVLQSGATVVPATVTYTAATRIASLTPTSLLADLTTYTVTVKGGAGGVTDPAGNPMASDTAWSFTTTTSAPPFITNVSPPSGEAGTAITITGSNFGQTVATGTVTFNGAAAIATSWSTTSIVVPVPTGATSGNLVVTVGGRASNSVNFSVTVPAPSISGLSPTSGPAGTPVTINGSHLAAGLLVGKIGWWGPFASGVAPNNRITGKPNGSFVGTPVFTSDGGGAITSDASNYLDIPDGGAGGVYDWTSGPWSAQVDFAFPAAPVFPGGGPLLLVSKGAFVAGTGWEIQIDNVAFQGKYRIGFESNHGIGSYDIVGGYLIEPGAFSRALFVCDETGNGVWYVNGSAWSPQPCTPSSPGATDLLIGRYSGDTDAHAPFPISRVQIWNRALTAVEAVLSTSTDATFGTVTFNGTQATPTSWSQTSVVAPVPPGATTGPVVVTVGGQSSNGVSFTVPDTTPPTVSGVTPPNGATNVATSTHGHGDVQ